MNFLNLIRKESVKSLKTLIFMALVSGVANGVLLAVINTASISASNQETSFRFLMLFAITISIFLYTKKFSLKESTILVENILNSVRLRISDKIRKADLLFIEKLGRPEIYTVLTQKTNLISQSTSILINACQSAIMLVFCILYIAWLSKTAFFITAISISAAVMIYLSNMKGLRAQIQESIDKETEFFGSLNHILEGMKEIKLNKNKNDDLFGSYEKISHKAREIKIDTGLKFIGNFMFAQVFWYILICIIIFLLPTLNAGYADVVVKTTMAILFIIGPLEMLVGSIPVFAQANVAIDNVYQLEQRLDEAGGMDENFKNAAKIKAGSFKKIEIKKLCFQYTNEEDNVLFSIGPINMSIKSGELLFIVGGNGSGKTTLLKLITGLYYPQSGEILMDGKEIKKRRFPVYREFFTGVFGDFHLFDRLYGQKDVEEKDVNDLIKLMQLEEKTEFIDGKFSTIKLSTGQRKRLAVIAALLDDKPILVFDELAADQDPEFRKFFYEVFLKDLKKKGKTVIAISHDDRYFHVADKVVKMEEGKIVRLGKNAGKKTKKH